jgi:hypothetical protein
MTGNAGDVALFIDPFSHHFEGDALFDGSRTWANGEDVLAPYRYARDWFERRGVRVHTADRLMRREVAATTNVYISLGIVNRYRALARRPDVILSAFFAFECPIVEPSLYRELTRVQRYVKRLFSYSDAESLQPFLRGPIHCQHFFCPQAYESVHDEMWRRADRKFLVMINGNKLPAVYLHELYTERMRAVEYFGRTGEIDLYGVGWDVPSYRMGRTWVPATVRQAQRRLLQCWQRLRPDPLLAAARRVYRGQAASKADVLSQYTFAICFENMILKGWITEKIFDCFFTGTVPIYLGSPDITERVPPECFIDMRRFHSYDELRQYLKSLNAADVQRYKDSARAFLCSPAYRPFSAPAFAEILARIVAEDTGVDLGLGGRAVSVA